MRKKLTISDILDLADQHELTVRAHYPAQTLDARQTPKPTGLSVFFNSVQPQAWQVLMTHLAEIPVVVFGTRQSHASGALDDQLYPEYAALLPQVNPIRSQLNLAQIWE